MAIRIVTDTTCDIPPEIAAELGITVIPDYINVGQESFLDGVDITRREFYERLPGWRIPPTTSAPGVDVFRLTYERLAAEGAEGIVSMHLTEKLSNLSNVARLGAQAARGVAVTVAPGYLSLAGGFVAIAAGQAAQRGASLNEVLEVIHDVSERTYIFASLATLEFLRRSGRVPHLLARIGAWFQILPVMKLHLEEIEMDPVRTQKSGIERVIHLAEALGPLEQLGIVHANAPQKVADMLIRAAHLFPAGKERPVMDVTPVIGTHTGPGMIGLVAVRAAGRR